MDFNVKKIAKLAKIKITDEEEIKLEKNIQKIIHMLEKLNTVDLGVNSGKELEDILLSDLPSMRYREDIVDEYISSRDLLYNVPECIADCIVVPKIVE